MIGAIAVALSLYVSLSDAALDFAGCNGIGLESGDNQLIFANDECGSMGDSSWKFKCLDSTTIQHETYTTDDCSGDVTSYSVESNDNVTFWGETWVGTVNCGDSDTDCAIIRSSDSYDSADCSGTSTGSSRLPFIAGSCQYFPGGNTSALIECDGSDVKLSVFTSDDCSGTAVDTETATDECEDNSDSDDTKSEQVEMTGACSSAAFNSNIMAVAVSTILGFLFYNN